LCQAPRTNCPNRSGDFKVPGASLLRQLQFARFSRLVLEYCLVMTVGCAGKTSYEVSFLPGG
jgi:hypothetical protein